jgi:hypothetical protein
MNRQLPSNSSSSGNNSGPCYMVWGASIGWLALYAALTNSSWRVVGVELLPLLVQVAQHTAHAAGLTGVCRLDTSTANLSYCSICIATCWQRWHLCLASATIFLGVSCAQDS